MPSYDTPGLLYDQPGVFYDEAEPTTQRGTRMAKVKLNLSKLTIRERLALAQQIITAMTGNANFTTPNPPLATLQTLLTAATTKTDAADAAAVAAEQATSERNTAVDALVAALNSEAAYVETTSGGEEAKILSAGMSVRALPAPVGPLPQVTNLSVTPSDNEGELDAQWDPVRGAKSYVIETSPDPITSTSWKNFGSVTASKAVVEGLTSGTRCWIRVRAIGSAGPAPWSDPATRIVP